jgi:hypothetical protein
VNLRELRTRDALHRYGDDVNVSEQDLDRMEAALARLLDDTAQPPRPRRSPQDWLVAAVAATALVVGSLALWQVNHQETSPAGRDGSSAPLIAPELVGLWLNTPDSTWLWEITADGGIGWFDAPEAYLRGEAAQARVTARDGDLYTVAYDNDQGQSCTRQLRAVVVQPGSMTMAPSAGVCARDGSWMADSDPVPDEDPLHLKHVSPGEAGAPPLTGPFEREEAAALREVAQLRGVWVDGETGTVLVVGLPTSDSALTYVMDDDGDGSTRPDQRGTISAREGRTTVHPLEGEARCAPVFRDVVTDVATLTTTSGPGGCAPEGTQQTWQRLG